MRKWTEKISGWLKKGKDDAKMILDIPWEVEITDGEAFDRILARHPRFPFPVSMAVSDEFVQMVIDQVFAVGVLRSRGDMDHAPALAQAAVDARNGRILRSGVDVDSVPAPDELAGQIPNIDVHPA